MHTSRSKHSIPKPLEFEILRKIGLLTHTLLFVPFNVQTVSLQYTICKSVLSIRVENSMDPYQMASPEAN